jgi:hypothetical protein
VLGCRRAKNFTILWPLIAVIRSAWRLIRCGAHQDPSGVQQVEQQLADLLNRVDRLTSDL